MGTNHKIISGDSRAMTLVPDSSVHLVVTSPPYWQLKDYGTEEQIGFHDSYEQYINDLNLVWKECYRALHSGCRLCVNIGDQFARAVYYGRYKVIPIRQEIIKFCESIGFDYMGAVIWQKVTTTNSSGGGVQMGSYPYPRNGILKLDYEFILTFKKLGTAPKPTKEQKELSKMTAEEWNTFFAGHWNFPGARQSGHIASFPEELPHRLIKMFSFVDETVLDPFAGSGTTALAARNVDRNSIGYEINPEYIPIIKGKLDIEQKDLKDSTYAFVDQEPFNGDRDTLIQQQPYIFKDPHAFNNKVDVKKVQFGSKIDKHGSPENESFFKVKKILDPERIQLENGDIVKLIGVILDPLESKLAIDYLIQKLVGKKVLLRDDELIVDRSNERSAYVYLKNRTFVNAHLIKTGFVQVDMASDYKLKSKFEKLHLSSQVTS